MNKRDAVSVSWCGPNDIRFIVLFCICCLYIIGYGSQINILIVSATVKLEP